MNFLPYANLLEQIFVVLSGLVYLLPLQKRETIELRLLSGLIMGGTLMVGPAMVLPQNGSTNFLLVVLDLVVMSFVVYYCATIKKSAAFYVAIWSLVTSQFFMNLWHVLYQLSPFRNNGSLAALLWGVLGFYSVGLAIVGLTTAKCMPEKGKYHIGPRQMTSSVLFLAVFEMLDQMMRIVHFGRYNLMYYVVLLVVQLYCVSLLFIQSELFKKSALEKELFTMNMLMKQQEEQYEITRDNIDMINQKCHDLKHQVRALR